MWNFLIVLIIAVIMFMLNPLKFNDLKPSVGMDKKTKTEVNKVLDETTTQIEKARTFQQEQASSDN